MTSLVCHFCFGLTCRSTFFSHDQALRFHNQEETNYMEGGDLGQSGPQRGAKDSEYLTVQLLHGDQVQRLERMSRRGDEVEAGVDPRVMVVEEGAFNFQFLLQVGLELGINVLHDRLVARTHKSVSKTRFQLRQLHPHPLLQLGEASPAANIITVPSSLRARGQVPHLITQSPSPPVPKPIRTLTPH